MCPNYVESLKIVFNFTGKYKTLLLNPGLYHIKIAQENLSKRPFNLMHRIPKPQIYPLAFVITFSFLYLSGKRHLMNRNTFFMQKFLILGFLAVVFILASDLYLTLVGLKFLLLKIA